MIEILLGLNTLILTYLCIAISKRSTDNYSNSIKPVIESINRSVDIALNAAHARYEETSLLLKSTSAELSEVRRDLIDKEVKLYNATEKAAVEFQSKELALSKKIKELEDRNEAMVNILSSLNKKEQQATRTPEPIVNQHEKISYEDTQEEVKEEAKEDKTLSPASTKDYDKKRYNKQKGVSTIIDKDIPDHLKPKITRSVADLAELDRLSSSSITRAA